MTAGELIAKLQEFDPALSVELVDWEGCDSPVEDVVEDTHQHPAHVNSRVTYPILRLVY